MKNLHLSLIPTVLLLAGIYAIASVYVKRKEESPVNSGYITSQNEFYNGGR